MRSVEADVRSGFGVVKTDSGQSCRLAMQELWLVGRVLPVGARLMVRHVFRSAETGPVEVVYAFMLPRDAALRKFRLSGERFSVRSELRLREEARQIYEEGIEKGHLASLAQQYGDGLVNLAVGNIRPGETVEVFLEMVVGVEVHEEGFRFRFPFTLAPAYHRRARPIEVEPDVGEVELPVEEFDDLMLPIWKKEAKGLHRVGFQLWVCTPGEIQEVGSPSHALRIQPDGESRVRVSLGRTADVPNRDLVLDVRHKTAEPLVLAGVDRRGVGRFAAVIPSRCFGSVDQGPRRVVFVVDRSGSMSGLPMKQALQAVESCLGMLREEDRFGIVCFDDAVERFSDELLAGNQEGKDKARKFLHRIDARGGTELAAGLEVAVRMLGGAGEIFLITDGEVLGTEAILKEVRTAGIRIHCLGIGSSSQDRFIALLGQESGGTGRMVTPREDVVEAARALFAGVSGAVAREVRLELRGLEEAQLAPEPPETVYPGTPMVVFGSAQGQGQGWLEISWKNNQAVERMTLPVVIHPAEEGQTLALLQGARLITQMEARYEEPDVEESAQKSRAADVAARLEALSREFGLASRRMSLVAVLERQGDESGQVPQTLIVPVAMPEDVEFGSYFGSGKAEVACGAVMYKWARPALRVIDVGYCPPSHVVPTREQVLQELFDRIDLDGGMRAQDPKERILLSLLTVLLLAEEAAEATVESFRSHRQQLMDFLTRADLSLFSEEKRELITEILRRLAQQIPIRGPWLNRLREYLEEGTLKQSVVWRQLRRAIQRHTAPPQT